MANTKLSRPKSSDGTKAKNYSEVFNADNELLNTETYSTIGNNLVEDAKMSVRNVDVFYGDKQAIRELRRRGMIEIFEIQTHSRQSTQY